MYVLLCKKNAICNATGTSSLQHYYFVFSTATSSLEHYHFVFSPFVQYRPVEREGGEMTKGFEKSFVGVHTQRTVTETLGRTVVVQLETR